MSKKSKIKAWSKQLQKKPLDANLHLDFSFFALKIGLPFLALAELKTAQFLVLHINDHKSHQNAIEGALPNLIDMNHNQFFRFYSLKNEIISQTNGQDSTILDVGGGHGELSAFLPNYQYCLAEPAVNGITGHQLPFEDESFDWVVSCHVLEHIPSAERENFLDQLLSKSKNGVILLNPFSVAHLKSDEFHQLAIDITGAGWAIEHKECGLPLVKDIEEYAKKKDLNVSVQPNGNAATTTALVFLDHFAGKAKRKNDWIKVNRFINENYSQPSHRDALLN